VRFAYNRVVVDRFNDDYFEASDLGIKDLVNLSPTREMLVAVVGGFNLMGSTSTKGLAENNSFQMSDDLTMVRGRSTTSIGDAQPNDDRPQQRSKRSMNVLT
jgi:hypothetical protein